MTTTTTQTREIKLKTNLNGKLAAEWFIHIQLSGTNGIPESVAESTIFKFTTQDNTHPPVYAKLKDSIHQPLYELSEYLIQLSHNMEKKEFVEKVLAEVKGTNLNTEMTVYFYKKES